MTTSQICKSLSFILITMSLLRVIWPSMQHILMTLPIFLDKFCLKLTLTNVKSGDISKDIHPTQ